MNHIDLFSGIGGFALAARNVWGDEYNNVCFCEINKYAQAVLRKNFGKDVVICEDIRALKAEQFGVVTNADRGGRVHGKPEIKSAKGSHKTQREPISSVGTSGLRIDLLTGGFPCQPFSQAGQRRGTEDDRFLWPEMLRVISEFRPTWIIGENVAGLLSMAEFDGKSEVASETDLFGNNIDIHTKRGRGILYRIIGELEQIGYSVQTFVIPACAVNAPHRRDRVWIVAHRENVFCNGGKRDLRVSKRSKEISESGNGCRKGDDTKSKGGRLPKSGRTRDRRDGFENKDPQSGWDEPWLTVATRTCVRGMDDGLPGEMDGATLSKAGHRVERLKALGNAIVPAVAEQIMQAIKRGSAK